MRRSAAFNRLTDSQRHALDWSRNLVVRANAGSGKTTVLLERILQLCAARFEAGADFHLSALVVMTFTRNAAAQLSRRLSEAMTRFRDSVASPVEQAYWRRLADEVPHAAIGTIDSFCNIVVREFTATAARDVPVSGGFQVVDPYESRVFREEAIERAVNRLESSTDGSPASRACRSWLEFEGFDTLNKHLLKLLDSPVDPRDIFAAHRDVPSAMQQVFDLWQSLPIVQKLNQRRDALIAAVEEVLHVYTRLEKPSDTLSNKVHPCFEVPALLRACAMEQDIDAFARLRDILLTKGGQRRKNLTAIKEELDPLQDEWTELLKGFEFDIAGETRGFERAAELTLVFEEVHREYLSLCRQARQFDFATIARTARDLLAHHLDVRTALKQRYRYIMVDEFQDTNQLQWEIVSWLAGNGPDQLLDKDRLFLVGDPQQSIYRFRHADVRVFERAARLVRRSNEHHGTDRVATGYDAFLACGDLAGRASTLDERLGLITFAENFRSIHPAPLKIVDRVFHEVFDSHGRQAQSFEVTYSPLASGLPAELGDGEVRYVLAPEETPEEESEGPVAEQVRRIIDQLISLHGAPFRNPDKKHADRLSWGDMAVLLASRHEVLFELERQLRLRGVPFVVAGGVGFWQRQEVRDVVNLASYLANPADGIALLGVLRGPIGQLTDSQVLLLSILGAGRLTDGLAHIRRTDEGLFQASSAALLDAVAQRRQRGELATVLEQAWSSQSEAQRRRLGRIAHALADWGKRVDRMAHSDLLQRCLEETGAYAIYAAMDEADLVLANLEQLFAIVREEEGQSADTLARVARRLRDRVDSLAEFGQAPETHSADAVKVMTIHAAKGLEFPVVAIPRLERKIQRSERAPIAVVGPLDEFTAGFAFAGPGTIAVKVRHPVTPRTLFSPLLLTEMHKLESAQEEAESRRLFYVAATRAKERLILAGAQMSRTDTACWQAWLHSALGITDEDIDRGGWSATDGLRIAIITQAVDASAPASTAIERVLLSPCIEYIHEAPPLRDVAVTQVAPLLEEFERDGREFWLRRRKHLQPRLPEARSSDVPDDEPTAGAIVGSMIHRLLQWPETIGQRDDASLRPLLAAMAENLLAAENVQTGEADEPTDLLLVRRAVSDTLSLLAGFARHPEFLSELTKLVRLPGVSEAPFSLVLGRWHISGRYDRLIAREGGHEILDWKTDGGKAKDIVATYESQMRLYALALHRAGQAALDGDAVPVRLVLLRLATMHLYHFPIAELEDHAVDLEARLRQLDDYRPTAEILPC